MTLRRCGARRSRARQGCGARRWRARQGCGAGRWRARQGCVASEVEGEAGAWFPVVRVVGIVALAVVGGGRTQHCCWEDSGLTGQLFGRVQARFKGKP